MTEIEIRLRNAIKQAAERGFESYTIRTSRGDSNCPHPVTYHPQDGHGYEDDQCWFDLSPSGNAAYDEETEYGDALEVLCRVFESFPKIKERDLIGEH